MDDLKEVVKKVLSNKNENKIFITENSDESNLYELQSKGYIQITKHEPPNMMDDEYMKIVKGPRFKEL
ncbi:hypothetical protein NS341_07415 [Staphylococcus xylosus]|uniref:hypothetical protein n=1 Tax=Staphylococcus xylosus TaxID=1288 RepID=UPI000734A2B7|nr:hypothetical protein [Staphylococcus xylosus]KTW22477.1 hypothetical protein NS341_07415 [Staphylococcus xylosus]